MEKRRNYQVKGKRMTNRKIAPGHWIVKNKLEDCEIIAFVSRRLSYTGGQCFHIIGYDMPISVEDEHYEFIKPFELEDIK